MKPAKYETSTGALASFLASRPKAAGVCDLYTFNFAGNINGGAPLTFATADVDVIVPYGSPITYSSRALYFDQLTNKSYGHWKVGLDVDTWQVIAAPTARATIGGQPWLQALRGGSLAGAIVQVDRCFFDIRTSRMPSGIMSLSPLGVVNVFTGRVAEVDIGRSNSVIAINSHLELLDVSMPRNLYQAGCRWTLFGPGCGLAASDFAVSGTIAAGTSGNVISVSVATPGGSGTYALGHIVMTSGGNEGFARSIRSGSPGAPGSFTLISPFPFPMTLGDTFDAYPGCNKTLASCAAFDNTAMFGGMPFIPAPETAT